MRLAIDRAVYNGSVGEESKTAFGWRLLWAVVGAALTFVVLSVSGLELAMPVMLGISAAAGIAVGIVGPMLLDLLALVS